MNQTLDYYNKNAQLYTETTADVNFTDTQNRFLGKLPSNAKLLDFGCGSGRDTKYFLEKGYQVDAADGSEELCRIASELTSTQVKQMLFQELDVVDAYDGIWACSSILHIPKDELKYVLCNMAAALKANGITYTSFKYGTFEGERSGRYFTDFTEDTFTDFIKDITTIELEEYWISADVRPGRENEKWLNVMLRKK